MLHRPLFRPIGLLVSSLLLVGFALCLPGCQYPDPPVRGAYAVLPSDADSVLVLDYCIYEWDYGRDPADTLLVSRLVLDSAMGYPYFSASNGILQDSLSGQKRPYEQGFEYAIHLWVVDGQEDTLTLTESVDGGTQTTRLVMPPATASRFFSLRFPEPGATGYLPDDPLEGINADWYPELSRRQLAEVEPERNYEFYMHYRFHRLARRQAAATPWPAKPRTWGPESSLPEVTISWSAAD